MSRRHLVVVTAVTTLFISMLSYEPASLLIYRLREPYFAFPVARGPKGIEIRNDAHGDGGFGAKRRNGRTHAGVDILAPVGTPVYASKSGVAFTGNVPYGYGKYVMIYHPDGLQTFYGHLSGWAVVSAQKVRRGDLIGFVGKTGNASRRAIQPHLHFEVRRGGESIDPTKLLS